MPKSILPLSFFSPFISASLNPLSLSQCPHITH